MVQRIRQGEVDFTVPSTGQKTKTWYRISGALDEHVVPLVLLHGGPGMSSDYLWPMEKLTELYGITTINYDQIGTGRSTHLPERMGDGKFWTEDLFMAELDNLLKELGVTGKYDILGQSWGGMLGSRYASYQPPRLRKLIISNSPASIKLWVEACNRLRSQLPKEVRDTLTKHERDGTTDSKEYEDAVMEFYKKHLCMTLPFPKPLVDTLKWVETDPTVYHTMNGPSEFYVIGTLKEWSVLDVLHKVKAETLVINAEHDEAQDSTTKPFADLIDGARWHKFEGASHCTHMEKPDEYYQVVGDFLRG